MKSVLKKWLSRAKEWSRRGGRRLASVILCGVLAAGTLSAAPLPARADSDHSDTYELAGTALRAALQEAVMEGRTVSEDLNFSGEHAEEYAQLLEADGTLYELELPEDPEAAGGHRDKTRNLRIFARVEGKIPVEEAYEIDGPEEIVFLVSNKTGETATARMIVDGRESEVITILPADSIPAGKEPAGRDRTGIEITDAGSPEEEEVSSNQEETGDRVEEAEDGDKNIEDSKAENSDTDVKDADGEGSDEKNSGGEADLTDEAEDAAEGDDTGSGEGTESSSDNPENSAGSILGSAISLHVGSLLAAGKATDSDADEKASSSDASRIIDGTVYESVRLGRKGAAAFVTTAADLKLDEAVSEGAKGQAGYTAEDDNVTVSVTAPEGALPEGAELRVTAYEEGSDEYAAAAEATGWDPDGEEAGMAVLDLSFYVDGEEVEPDEAVSVRIDASGLVPEEADTDTVEVWHLVEDEDGLKAELVADAGNASDGSVDTRTVTAEFMVDHFSNFTISWGNGTSSHLTCYLYDADNGNQSINVGNNSGLQGSVTLSAGETYDFNSADNAYYSFTISNGGSGKTYTFSYATITVTTGKQGTTYPDVQSITYDGSMYTIVYIENNTTKSVTVLKSSNPTITANLYYTSSGSTTIYVWYDRVTADGTTLTAQNDSVGIQSVTLDAASVPHGDGGSSTYKDSTSGLAVSNPYSTSGQTVSVTVTPADGYYVTFICVNCCGSGAATGCETYQTGGAYTSSFTVSSAGAITVDVTLDDTDGFHHNSNATNYFILVSVSPIPSPLYVEYDYGDIVDWIQDQGTDSSAFSTADGWTEKSDSNDYGNGTSDTNADITYVNGDYTGYGVMTDDTQYKYAYTSGGTVTAADWIHKANTVTDLAKSQAAAAGYVFAGWKAEYYTSVTVAGQTADKNGYQYDYNNWKYTFSNSYGSTSYGEGDPVTLTTNVRMIAQWLPIGVTLTKTVAGLPADCTDSAGYGFTIWYSGDDGVTWKEYRTASITVAGNGSVSTVIYPVKSGLYKVTETSGDTNQTISGTTYYITVSDGGTVTVGIPTGWTEETISGETVAVLSDGWTVTNTYTDTPGFELPGTGGPGTLPFRIAGLLLMGSAAYQLHETLRRRRNQ